MPISIRTYGPYREDELLALYESVGWTNYTHRPALLREAYRHSLCAFAAYDGERLAGVVRAVGDGASILYVQDLLVHPDYQRLGIGARLLRALLAAFPDVYQTVLLTDDQAPTAAFYESLGFSRAASQGCAAFVRISPPSGDALGS